MNAQPDPPADRISSGTYDHALAGTGKPWRGAVAIVLLFASLLLFSVVFGAIALAFEVLTGGMNLADPDSLIAITPSVLLSSNLALAALIPISMLLQRWLFGVPVRFMFSVTGRFRWKWFGSLALIIVPLWVVYIGVSFALEPSGEVRIDAGVIALLAVVVLTTPLQAAGEEFGFRGLVQRSAGSWFRNPTTAFVVSTLISGAAFGAAHFAADPWLIAYYFLFGVSASIAARLTGGLEAPILVHVVNNVLIFVPAALLGQLDAGIDRSEGAGGPFILLPIAMVLTAAALSGWWARRNGITVRAPSIPVLDKRMPSFTGIDHLALTVTDLDVSVPFYEKLWGMPVAGSLEGNDLTRRIFRLPSGTTVGLTQHDTSASTAFSPFTPGMDHVGFGVESVEELGRWVAHLDELGIDNSGLVEADYGVAVSFTDPDGTALEFFVGR